MLEDYRLLIVLSGIFKKKNISHGNQSVVVD